VVDLGWVDGKRRRKYTKKATQRAAVEWVRETLNAKRSGRIVGRSVTLDEWFELYLREVAGPKVRPSTLANYQRDARLHILPSLGRLSLEQLEPQHLTRLYAAKRDEGLSAASVRHLHATVRRSLNVAMRWALVGRNVALLVEPPARTEYEVKPLSVVEARTMLAAARTDRLEARWVVGLSLGLRQGEALGLWWDDVDLEAGTLRVRRQLARTRGRTPAEFAALKSARSRRTLSLPTSLVTVLREHRARQAGEQLNAPSWADARLVFATPLGTPIDSSNDARAFKSLLRRAGVRPVRLHDLRHTAATLLLAQGMHPRVVMEVLGHSQISLTMNTYAHVMPSLLDEAAASMETSLWGLQ